MLVKPPIEELLPHVENRYTLALAISKRVRQLVDGAKPYRVQENDSLITLACEELANSDIYVVPADVKPFIPQVPSPEEDLSENSNDDGDNLEEIDLKPEGPDMETLSPALTEEEEESHKVRSVLTYMSDDDVFLMPEEMDESTYEEVLSSASYTDIDDDDSEDEAVSVSSSRKEMMYDDEEEIDQDLSDIEKISDSQLYKDRDDDLFDDDLDF